jgi:glycerol-3-phosphate acyltransferase PlsY
VGIYDALKGAAIVLIAKLIGLETVFQVLIGIAMIAGHNWPVFLRFNAGRGLATTLGVCFVIFPFGIWIFIAGAVFTLLVGSSALPALVGMAAMPVASFIRGEPLETTLGLTALVAILIIRRLTAPISERSRQVKKSELLLNRFLFDRISATASNGCITVRTLLLIKREEKNLSHGILQETSCS